MCTINKKVNLRNEFEFICSATESCRDGNFIIELNGLLTAM